MPGACVCGFDPKHFIYNSRMRRGLSLAGNVLFIFYCTAVGVYLLLRPWSLGTAHGAGGLSASGFFRGFVSGLGLVHLVVGIADVRTLSRSLDQLSGGEE